MGQFSEAILSAKAAMDQQTNTTNELTALFDEINADLALAETNGVIICIGDKLPPSDAFSRGGSDLSITHQLIARNIKTHKAVSLANINIKPARGVATFWYRGGTTECEDIAALRNAVVMCLRDSATYQLTVLVADGKIE
jgi:hypothetical protein